LRIRTIISTLALALLLAVLHLPIVAQDNPLLVTPTTPYQTPPFDRIQNAHYLPAVQEGIRRHDGRDLPPLSTIPQLRHSITRLWLWIWRENCWGCDGRVLFPHGNDEQSGNAGYRQAVVTADVYS